MYLFSTDGLYIFTQIIFVLVLAFSADIIRFYVCFLQLPSYSVMLAGKIAVAYRGGCIFIEKARLVQKLGAVGLIIVGKHLFVSDLNLPDSVPS